ncbi:efflux RND transporter periplasmic adaptor subunit [Acidihalobacter prosperus]|uniref:efflux RND transporter periplasmic adaptor subunit n=1 Tax=Acidihalobacter prosperus TaxID=160660 RepID=UPI00191BCFEE|nr:efflux RND transporter periplasmic adaptor subunit [Acidihalobacter prosperus]
MKEKPRGRRRARALRLAIAAFVLVGLVWGAYYLLVGRYQVATDDAYVHGDRIQISPQVAGTVVAVEVRDTDYVKRGQVLVRLDTANADVALSQAEAQLAAAVRQVREAFARVHALEATVAMDRAQLRLATDNARRQQRLLHKGMTSAEKAQQMQTEMQVAAHKLALDQAQLAGARAAVSGTRLADNPVVRQAAARVRKDYLDVARTRIVSPVTGYVADSGVEVGQQVKPGGALMDVIPLSDVWVDANFKESELRSVKIGQPVRLTSDFYGSGVVYHGHVIGLMPGTGSVFSLLPAQNATGNWIKVVQRVPVRISLPADELKQHPLRLGLSMNATVDIRDQQGASLASVPRAQKGASTDVYAQQLKGADALVARIIRSNSGKSAPVHG